MLPIFLLDQQNRYDLRASHFNSTFDSPHPTSALCTYTPAAPVTLGRWPSAEVEGIASLTPTATHL